MKQADFEAEFFILHSPIRMADGADSYSIPKAGRSLTERGFLCSSKDAAWCAGMYLQERLTECSTNRLWENNHIFYYSVLTLKPPLDFTQCLLMLVSCVADDRFMHCQSLFHAFLATRNKITLGNP